MPARIYLLRTLLILLTIPTAWAGEVEIDGRRFTLPDGLHIELVAGPPLVERPVSADFDQRGRLYVTDSSGSNEHVDVQREKRPHRIVRLQDNDGDGAFDSSTVFADRLMFPEGALWHDGSLYVAAPPEIWKFTDLDDDGVADQREVWFDGKTLTHCANDLHGPYLGPDGWFYWCKGAFAEQQHPRIGKSPLISRAAHIFRRHPAGGPIDIVMTGGMDNPVEIAFTPAGERIFTTTFLVQPAGGRRDGLIHAVYGGVYGKDHGVLDGHPRTGALMPVLSHMGVAASCGLTRLRTCGLGAARPDDDCRNHLISTSFNLHKLTRHVLFEDGASLRSRDQDLLVCEDLDFHPTDVLEDADGSLIVVDTGGWFRLCCPTSQLEKPDVLGGIYRIKSAVSQPHHDPRGLELSWVKPSAKELAKRLADSRFAVRERAKQALRKLGASAVDALIGIMGDTANADLRLHAVWAMTPLDDPRARAAIRTALNDSDATVRQAALHAVSLNRDSLAADGLRKTLANGSSRDRRAAAEALGRIGDGRDVVSLLAALPSVAPEDRTSEHSLIYAAIEIDDAAALKPLMDHPNDRIQGASLIALDQLESGSQLRPQDIASLLTSDNARLNEISWWIAAQHPDWADTIAAAFAAELRTDPTDPAQIDRLVDRLIRFSGSNVVQLQMASALTQASNNRTLRIAIIKAMASSGQRSLPESWHEALANQLSGDSETILTALQAIERLTKEIPDTLMIDRLRAIVRQETKYDSQTRLLALSLIPPDSRQLSKAHFQFVCDQLDIENDLTRRSLAIKILRTVPLQSDRLRLVAKRLPRVGTMELDPLLDLFRQSKEAVVGRALVDALLESPAATTLDSDRLQSLLAQFDQDTIAKGAELVARIERENRTRVQRMNTILERLPQADARRGLQVFQSSAAACIACHSRGYLGGDVGPDLDGIGKARSERDLLESILFPSLTFVRNYEPAVVLTVDGQIYNGVIRQSTDEAVTLQLNAQKSIVIPQDEIEQTRFSDVSIMPAGLDKQLTPQQLADLVKYLKEDL